jgi:di/tricarboxylate transporter
LYAVGIFDSYSAAMNGYSSTLFFFLLLLFLLGQAINDVDLDVWLVRNLFPSVDGPAKMIRMLGWTQFVVSLVIPSSVARTVTFIPIIRRLESRHRNVASEFNRSAGFVIGHINPMASIAIMTGGALPIIASELIRINVRYISWLEWSIFLLPPAIVLYVSSTLVASHLFSSDISSVALDDESGEAVIPDDKDTDQLSKDQMIVISTMLFTILLWLVGSLYQIPTILPAVLAVAILSAPGVTIIDQGTITEISWGILFLIGTMLSILDAMNLSGTIQFLIDTISAVVPFYAANHWQVIVLLLATSVLIRMFFSAAPAAMIVILPIMLEFGRTFGVNELYLSFSIMILMITPTLFPFNTIPVLISYDEGFLSAKDVFVFGMYTFLLAAGTIVFGWVVYWPLID